MTGKFLCYAEHWWVPWVQPHALISTDSLALARAPKSVETRLTKFPLAGRYQASPRV